jgi:hypothetical protein
LDIKAKVKILYDPDVVNALESLLTILDEWRINFEK